MDWNNETIREFDKFLNEKGCGIQDFVATNLIFNIYGELSLDEKEKLLKEFIRKNEK